MARSFGNIFKGQIQAQLGALIMGPLFALFVVFMFSGSALSFQAQLTLAIGCWMAIWWATEAIPIPITALLPLVLFPFFDIATPKAVGASFGHPLIFLFLGGFILALALERSELHRRIALNILLKTGSRADGLLLGFMVASAVISMWVTNTATTMMIMPIALSIVDVAQLSEGNVSLEESRTKLTHALLLGIAYASTIGGLGTLVGTVPNALLAAFVEEQFGLKVTFVGWMMIGVPLIFILLPLTWWILARRHQDLRHMTLPQGSGEVHQQLRALGVWNRRQKAVAAIFVCTAALWVLRPVLPSVLGHTFRLTDDMIAVFAAILLFVTPVDLSKREFLMDWKTAKRLPWDVLLLFGGGLALASAMKETGASVWIGEQIQLAALLPTWAVIGLVAATIIFLTELTSNTATTATFLPIVAALSVTVKVEALILLVPATVAASCAFMLPVATPPNAIVYGSGRLTIGSMMRAGWLLNITATVLLVVFSALFLPMILGL